MVGRVAVCQGAFKNAYGISNNLVQPALKKVRGGTTHAVVHKEGLSNKTDQWNTTSVWLKDFFETTAERMPDCNGKTQVWHLSPTYTKDAVYQRYKAWCTENNLIEPYSLGHFLRVWNEDFPHVTIPARCRFAQCST